MDEGTQARRPRGEEEGGREVAKGERRRKIRGGERVREEMEVGKRVRGEGRGEFEAAFPSSFADWLLPSFLCGSRLLSNLQAEVLIQCDN